MPDSRIHFSIVLVIITLGMVDGIITWGLSDLHGNVTTSPIQKSRYDHFFSWKIHSKMEILNILKI